MYILISAMWELKVIGQARGGLGRLAVKCVGGDFNIVLVTASVIPTRVGSPAKKKRS